jgi:hypothetical protein
MVMVVTSAVVLAGGGGNPPAPAQQVNAGRPPVVQLGTATSEAPVEAPAAAATTNGSAATNTPQATAPSQDAGMQQVGPLPLLAGTNEQGRQESADHPAKVEAFDTWVTANPNAVLEPLAQILGGSQ